MTATTAPPTRASLELEASLDVFSLACVVPLLWVLILGWGPGEAIAVEDGGRVLGFLARLVAVGGDLDRFLIGEAGGGAPPFTVAILPIQVQWAAWAGLSATAVVVVGAMSTQILIAALAAGIVRSLAEVWRPAGPAPRVPVLLIATAVAFAPAIVLRIAVGHLNLTAGVAAVLAPWLLVVDARAGRASLVRCAVAIVAVWSALPGGVPLLVYGALFLGPAVVASAWRPHDRRGTALVLVGAIAVVGSGVACGASAVVELSRAMAVGDFPRSFDPGYLFRFAPLGVSAFTRSFSTAASPHAWHDAAPQSWELVFPWGLAAGALLFVPVRRSAHARAVAAAIVCAWLVVLAVAARPAHLLELLVDLLPIVGTFRIPERALLLVIPFSLCAGGAGLIARGSADLARGVRSWWLLIVAIAGAALGWPSVVELCAWVGCALVLAPRLPAALRVSPATIAAVWCAVALTGARGFCAPPLPTEASMKSLRALGGELQRADPRLAAPLQRARLHDPPEPFGENAGVAAGVQTLDGLLNPPRRFAVLAAALERFPFDAGRTRYLFPPENPAARAMNALYNVILAADVDERGDVVIVPAPAAIGPAWAPRAIEHAPDAAALVERLRAIVGTEEGDAKADEIAALRSLVVVDDGDAATAPFAGLTLDPACAGATIGAPTRIVGEGLALDVVVPATCVVVLSHNFLARFVVVGTVDGAPRPLASGPVWGSLLGVVAPQGTTRIEVVPHPLRPPWLPAASRCAALLLFAAGAWLLTRRRG